jgi:hypothetical protein
LLGGWSGRRSRKFRDVRFCTSLHTLHENFDSVTPPALPADWLLPSLLARLVARTPIALRERKLPQPLEETDLTPLEEMDLPPLEEMDLAASSSGQGLPLLEIASVLVRRDHIASYIEHANQSIMRADAKLCVADCISLGMPVMH